MRKSMSVQRMTAAALLIALGIAIPLLSPVKIVLEPASFTLASHLPIFLSMFISPVTALCVTLGTVLGFAMGPFTPVIVLRAASHIVFAVLGAVILQKKPQILSSPTQTFVFATSISAIHALCEIAIVSVFYLLGGMSAQYYNKGLLVSVFGLVGVGTLVHSLIDFSLAFIVLSALVRQKQLVSLFLPVKPFSATASAKANNNAQS